MLLTSSSTPDPLFSCNNAVNAGQLTRPRPRQTLALYIPARQALLDSALVKVT